MLPRGHPLRSLHGPVSVVCCLGSVHTHSESRGLVLSHLNRPACALPAGAPWPGCRGGGGVQTGCRGGGGVQRCVSWTMVCPSLSPGACSNSRPLSRGFSSVLCGQVTDKVCRVGAWCTSGWASQLVPMVENPPGNVGNATDTGSIPGLARSPGGGNGNPPLDSCLQSPVFLPAESHGQRSLAGYGL